MIKIKVPATTANLGPGFDCLGMALNIYNTLEIYDDVSKLTIESSLQSDEVKNSEDNLIYKSMKRLYDEVGKKIPPFRIVENINIPISRGLGSSASCIVGGLTGANNLLGNPLNKDDILKLADEIEGHPDNVAPALLGGLVISTKTNRDISYIRKSIDYDLKLMVMIPDFTLSTNKARNALPPTINHKDAVFNVGRASLFTASLITGDLNSIKYAVEDRLHQPYRIKLIPDGDKIFKGAYHSGALAVFISGAGPSIMAVINDDSTIYKMQEFCSSLNTNWNIRLIHVDNQGTTILKE